MEKWDAAGIWQREARDATEHLTKHRTAPPPAPHHSKGWPSPECQQCHGGETLLWKELPQCHSDFLSSNFRPAPCQGHTQHPDLRSPKGPDIPKTWTKPMFQGRWADLHQPPCARAEPLVGASSPNFNPGEEPSPEKSLNASERIITFFKQR